ncbi:undecaprenyl-diphosphatase [Desmospora activa]|uniref:Undecaprenyl-diphosphatase n=1 Tax=Desmospora activa DSM 45169 TaxID=1121389 RepID=A0A2T4Z0D4_9BACL|nr:undecaprenyl-diphosphatase [Desmospora activa]PTM53201.1 undecaprenyl-diphosphatase [Desmospora activa DSM 45169]
MDYQLFEWINGWAGKFGWLDFLMIVMTEYGPYFFALVLFALFFFKKHRRGGITTGSTLALALGFSFLIGQLWERARPFVTYDDVNVLLYHAADASFPSDHTTGAFAIAFGLWHHHRGLGSIMFMLACLIGISRPFVGHHYPGDVLAGIAVAWIAAQIVKFVMGKMEARSAKTSEIPSKL